MRRSGSIRARRAAYVGNNGANTKAGLPRSIGSSYLLFHRIKCCTHDEGGKGVFSFAYIDLNDASKLHIVFTHEIAWDNTSNFANQFDFSMNSVSGLTDIDLSIDSTISPVISGKEVILRLSGGDEAVLIDALDNTYTIAYEPKGVSPFVDVSANKIYERLGIKKDDDYINAFSATNVKNDAPTFFTGLAVIRDNADNNIEIHFNQDISGILTSAPFDDPFDEALIDISNGSLTYDLSNAEATIINDSNGKPRILSVTLDNDVSSNQIIDISSTKLKTKLYSLRDTTGDGNGDTKNYMFNTFDSILVRNDVKPKIVSVPTFANNDNISNVDISFNANRVRFGADLDKWGDKHPERFFDISSAAGTNIGNALNISFKNQDVDLSNTDVGGVLGTDIAFSFDNFLESGQKAQFKYSGSDVYDPRNGNALGPLFLHRFNITNEREYPRGTYNGVELESRWIDISNIVPPKFVDGSFNKSGDDVYYDLYFNDSSLSGSSLASTHFDISHNTNSGALTGDNSTVNIDTNRVRLVSNHLESSIKSGVLLDISINDTTKLENSESVDVAPFSGQRITNNIAPTILSRSGVAGDVSLNIGVDDNVLFSGSDLTAAGNFELTIGAVDLSYSVTETGTGKAFLITNGGDNVTSNFTIKRGVRYNIGPTANGITDRFIFDISGTGSVVEDISSGQLSSNSYIHSFEIPVDYDGDDIYYKSTGNDSLSNPQVTVPVKVNISDKNTLKNNLSHKAGDTKSIKLELDGGPLLRYDNLTIKYTGNAVENNRSVIDSGSNTNVKMEESSTESVTISA